MENLGLSADFWRGKRILVTGHTGFKGGWLSIWLQGLGCDVAGYALPPINEPNFFDIASVADTMHSRIGDIRDVDRLRQVFNDYRPEIVFHLAAQSLVRESYASPVETYDTNVMGTVNVLEAARHSDDVRVLINVTSDKCYQNLERVEGYQEHEPMGGFDPYSSSKGCAELITAAYRQSFFSVPGAMALATARAGNVIGGGDWANDRLVPDIIRALAAGEAASIRNPASIRPWQHVLEPLSGYLLLAERVHQDPSFADGWNFGPRDEDSQPVAWLADRLCALWGSHARWENEAIEGEPHEANVLRLNIEKARTQLDWRPRLELSDALAWTVDWYKQWQEGGDVRAVTQEQIQRFAARASTA